MPMFVRGYTWVLPQSNQPCCEVISEAGLFKCHMLRLPPRCSLQMTFSLPHNAGSPIYPSRSQRLETICDTSSI